MASVVAQKREIVEIQWRSLRALHESRRQFAQANRQSYQRVILRPLTSGAIQNDVRRRADERGVPLAEIIVRQKLVD